MSYAAAPSTRPLLAADRPLAETTHVLHRAGAAGALGTLAGPLVLRRRPFPAWRASLLGSAALASVSVPFLAMERLSYHAIRNNVEGWPVHDVLYASHAAGTVLGAGIVHAARQARGRFYVPMKVLAAMLGKAHVEAMVLNNDACNRKLLVDC